eukprot:722509-Prorocentrum_minimum.AAC.1
MDEAADEAAAAAAAAATRADESDQKWLRNLVDGEAALRARAEEAHARVAEAERQLARRLDTLEESERSARSRAVGGLLELI